MYKSVLNFIISTIFIFWAGFVVSDKAPPSMYPQCMKQCINTFTDCNSHCNVDNVLSTNDRELQNKVNYQQGCSSSCMMNLNICQNGCSPYQGSTW